MNNTILLSRLFFANFAVDNKILNHYNMKAKVVDNRYLFF